MFSTCDINGFPRGSPRLLPERKFSVRIGVIISSIITFSQEKSETAKLVPPAGWQLFWRLLKNISAHRRPCFFYNYIFARKLSKSKIGAPYGVELFLSAPSSVHPSSIHPSIHASCMYPSSIQRERERESILLSSTFCLYIHCLINMLVHLLWWFSLPLIVVQLHS